MRTFVSAVAVILGVLLSAVAVPAIWLDRNVVQEDGFVALAAPLGRDDEAQHGLAAAAVGTINTIVVPPALDGVVQPALKAAASSLAGLPGYPAAWEETLRKSHRLSFADPRALLPDAQPVTSLTLDVSPLVRLVVQEISRTSGLPLHAPERTQINIGQPSQRQLIEQVSAYAPMGYMLAIAAGVAFALALVSARRRWAVVFSAGVAGLMLAGLWTSGSQLAGDAVRGAASGNEVADVFKNEFVAAASNNFSTWIQATAITGGVLLVAAVVIRIASPGRRRTTR